VVQHVFASFVQAILHAALHATLEPFEEFWEGLKVRWGDAFEKPFRDAVVEPPHLKGDVTHIFPSVVYFGNTQLTIPLDDLQFQQDLLTHYVERL
jgi:hypothetical protein